ncbi:MarR family winged helix-turn-helix transcriptional regulator [Paenibacillus sp. OV219]|uniref:MarR family winged helix-turn-helix transcriptional regulator n=1 Tax=Paenibacillus sp. OV219 TaxID=1884377 RepID=UPI0008C36CEC|nr:MarR family transcriptional regulator [Paenibacillus sp. OV219]SEM65215.1 DNA-binding transcriptional regulator, MarR family [Paenibacillus sp. OV219]
MTSSYAERFQKAITTTNRKIGAMVSHSLNGLTGPQCYLLKLIADEKRATASILADQMEVKPSAITVMLDRLVQNGFVSRMPDANDRRVTLLQLTDKGTEALAKMRTNYTSVLDQLLQQLGENEIERFVQSFEYIAAAAVKLNDHISQNPYKG